MLTPDGEAEMARFSELLSIDRQAAQVEVVTELITAAVLDGIPKEQQSTVFSHVTGIFVEWGVPSETVQNAFFKAIREH